MRPLYADIDLAALRHNLALLKQRCAPAKAYAVVKADAYGHGLSLCYPAMDAADGFFVLELEKAIWLRQQDPERPIVLMEGVFAPEEITLALEHRLELVIHHHQQLVWLENHARQRPLRLWLKLNLGMNRLGFSPQQAHEAYLALRSWPHTQIQLMAHFPSADEPGGTRAMVAQAQQLAWGAQLPWSLANSAATLTDANSHRDVVRLGLASYGLSPISGSRGAELGLRAVMRLHAELIATQQLNRGDQVGYNGTFRAEGPMRIGIVACGYADGYPQQLRNAPVAIDGLPSRSLGKVSMDMLAVDISGLPEAGIGSSVELWGPQIPAEDVAAAGVNPYSLVSALTWRVPREAMKNR